MTYEVTIFAILGAVKIWNANSSHCMFTQTFQNTHEQSEGNGDIPSQQAIVDVSFCETKNTVNLVTYDHNILLCDLEDLQIQKQVHLCANCRRFLVFDVYSYSQTTIILVTFKR